MHPCMIPRRLLQSNALATLLRSQSLKAFKRSSLRGYTCVCTNITWHSWENVQRPSTASVTRLAVLSVPTLYEHIAFRRLSSLQGSHGGGEAIAASTEEAESPVARLLKFVGWLGGFYSKKAILLRSAKTLYECCVEGVNYDHFYEACRMPDTFQSWFLVNQLHVWMCLVRLKEEGKDGRFMYRKLVEIMWQDVGERMKVLGVHDTTTRRDSTQELVENFYGLIFAYDEGLLSHDRVLAAALWRNMFHDKQNTDAIKLAQMVEYVRRQMQHLDSLDSKQLLTTGMVEWLPFQDNDNTKVSSHEIAVP